MINFWKDRRNFVIILLAVLVIIRIPTEGARFVLWVLVGAGLCSAADALINNLFLKRRIFPASAMISGLIVSGIIDYRQPWFILLIFTLLPVISKHIIKFNQGHIFNPANFALFVAAIFKIPLTWSIESNIFLIALFGIYFACSYKKFFHILGFLIFFTGLFAASRANPLGLINWFFLFIMLIEPKTSGYGFLRGFIFGSVAGISAFFMFKYLPAYDAFVSSLFIANLFNPVLEKVFLRK